MMMMMMMMMMMLFFSVPSPDAITQEKEKTK